MNEPMKAIITELSALRLEAQKLSLECLKRNGLSPGDPRDAFGQIFNAATITLELLAFYERTWSVPRRVASQEEADRAIKENGERMVFALKHLLFIPAMSAIEYTAKETLKAKPASPLTKAVFAAGNRVYLSGIMKETAKQGLPPADAELRWEPMVQVRNMLVHNNGIADTTKTYLVGGETINLNRGEMTQGKPRLFLALTADAMHLFDAWTQVV